jgi:HAD superfamily hydrolase (TIGR01509 family)
MAEQLAVIFDMDGVLVDSEPWHYKMEELIYAELGIEVPDQVHQTYLGTAADLMWSDLKRRYGLKQSLEELVQYDEEFRVEFFSDLGNLQPNPGVKKLLSGLSDANIPIAVATSSVPGIVDIILQQCGIRSFFDAVVTTVQAGRSKPAPDVYLCTAKKLEREPAGCLVFEDSMNGIRAAVDAGMTCVAFQPEGAVQHDISAAHHLITDFRHVSPETIRRWMTDKQFS